MPSRFEWSEIVIVGLVGGVAAGCLSISLWLGASIDNLLNFFGGAVGSGSAIAATLWLEKRKRARSLEQMMTAMVIVASLALRFRSTEAASIRPLILTLQQSSNAFQAARSGAVIENPLHQYGFQAALFWLEKAMDGFNEQIEMVNDGKLSTDSLLVNSRNIASTMLGPIEDFISMEGLPRSPLVSFRYLKDKQFVEASRVN